MLYEVKALWKPKGKDAARENSLGYLIQGTKASKLSITSSCIAVRLA
jgi:hypothetical protein